MSQFALGHVADIRQGRYLAKDDMSEDRTPANCIPVHGANGIIGWTARPMYEEGVPLVTCRGSNSGMVLWADGPLWVSNNAMAIIPHDGSHRFAYYALLNSPPYEVVSGSAQPQITHTALAPRPYVWPAEDQRDGIAAILSALDDKIELNRRMNETLEASARALFRDWFVDFGPTRAKAEGRPATLAPDLWSLFPDRLSVDGVPEGWEWGTLANLATLNPEVWGTKNHPEALAYVDLSNTKWGTIENIENYPWATSPSRARRVLRPGDTIVGTVRPGNGSYAYIGASGLTGSTGFAVLRPVKAEHRVALWCASTSSDNIERLAHLADGGAYPAVRPDVVIDTEIAIAPQSLLAGFERHTSPLLEQIEANKTESCTLAATRDALLPKLMSGELRVRDAKALAA